MKQIATCIGALVLAVGAGSFWYGRHEAVQRQKQVVAAPVGLPEPAWAMNMCPEAMKYFRSGMDRMKAVGVDYSSDQIMMMLRCADRDYNPTDKEHRLDVNEAKELYEIVLNPDSVLGRLVMKEPAPLHQLVKMPERYEPLVLNLIDYNNDGIVSKEEAKQAHYKLK